MTRKRCTGLHLWIGVLTIDNDLLRIDCRICGEHKSLGKAGRADRVELRAAELLTSELGTPAENSGSLAYQLDMDLPKRARGGWHAGWLAAAIASTDVDAEPTPESETKPEHLDGIDQSEPVVPEVDLVPHVEPTLDEQFDYGGES